MKVINTLCLWALSLFCWPCEIVPESWTVIIMVINYLIKVPRGFYDAPWNMGWSQDFKVFRDIIFKSCKCPILVLGERLSRSWCGIERRARGRKGLVVACNDILLKLLSVNLKKKKKSIIQIEETLKCCCKLLFACLVQAVEVTPSSRYTKHLVWLIKYKL